MLHGHISSITPIDLAAQLNNKDELTRLMLVQ